ncbi:MAG: glycosyltransferase family 39 protein [bacterium]|nr:glycosyltransferase family 39 protein [bacterium]
MTEDRSSIRELIPVIALFTIAKLALHLFTHAGYGYFRDELYYLACTEHLAAGYVDHPPLSVFVLWLVRQGLGDSLLALRLVPALAGSATVGLVGAMAARLGGGRWAVALAMTGALVAPVFLALDHIYSMNALDLFFWALAGYLVIGIVQQGNPRRWCLLGLVLGLALLNKISVLWLGAGLLVGLVITPERRWLKTPWPWVAGAIATAVFSPHVFWQMRNGWPTAEFIKNATGEKMAEVAPLDFVLGQVGMLLPFALPLWLAGLLFLFLHRKGKSYRILGWVYVAVFLILMLSGSSRSNYLAPAYTWLFAAGGVAAAGLLSRPRLTWLRPTALIALAILGAVVAPLALPVLPVDAYLRHAEALGQQPATEERKELGQLGQFFADMHGWEEITDTVVAVHRGLPPAEQAIARVFAPDYGVAGAIDLFGRRQGLAPVLSGHNSYWLWGPGDADGRVLLVVGGSEEELRPLFSQLDRAATIDCGLCIPYENGNPVWIGRDLRLPLAELWPNIKHYD